ncbi:TonB-dependent receptor SusC [termite gut metagenome]|uniref:TonB-dependent receptor SusC n=1 Tax=termite gut metagenome TaxID=433724 RepID=A0A5J4R2W9_9ZZZZ
MSVYKIIIFLASLFCSYIVFGQNSVREVEIKGIITDRQTGERLPGAYLFIKGTSTGTISDNKGQYVLHLNKGNYIICGSFMGYQTNEISFNADASQTINIQLESGTHELDEVIISSRAKNDNITNVNMGIERMSIKEIQRLPALMGEVDVLKTIRLLPGVQATAEGGSGFSVRGGAPDQNLILLDNTTVYNASHLLGFFSVFNNDVVSGFELYKGDLPLKYGGRLSSLLNVDTKLNMPEHFQGTGGIGIVSGRLMLEGKTGERTSWMVGGRRSFADLFFGLSPKEAIQNASLYFYDLNAKISHKFSGKDHLEANGYYGKDLFGAEMGEFNYGNVAASLLWKHSFSEKLFSNASLALSNYSYNVGADVDEVQVDWGAGITDIAFKVDFNQPVSNRWNLNYGISSILHRLSPGDISMTGLADYSLQKVEALEHGVYLSNEQKLTEKFSLKYGLRWSIFQNLGETTVYQYDTNYEVADSTRYEAGKIYHTYTHFEPRIGALFLINDRSSVKANYAHNVQFMQLAENSASGSPLNIWFAASPNIKPQTVDLFSAGYFRNFLDNRYETSVEVYYKDLKSVIDFAEHADLLLNEHFEGDIRTGTGKAYGMELSVKKNTGKLTGFLNYTLSRSERTIPEVNEGKTYLAPYDKTHAVNIAVNYELSKKLSVLATWVFATGTSTTYPAGRFEIGGEYFPIYSGRNEYRKPDYHRLDLSVNFVPDLNSKKRWKSEWNFSVFNAYGRKNPWLISYSQIETATPTATMTYVFQFVPSITYNFKF